MTGPVPAGGAPSQAAKSAWETTYHAEEQLKATYAANGIDLGSEYYRLGEALVAAYAAQWRQIEDLITDNP